MKQETRDKIPVEVGQRIIVTPEGRSNKGDFFFKVEGFVLFIKEVPLDVQEDTAMMVEVYSLKGKFGFARYVEER